jgi:hypothetical protein
MAKTTPSKPAAASPPAVSALAHTVKLAYPEELPAILTVMEHDGWQLLHIVPCRTTKEHAAYFRRKV